MVPVLKATEAMRIAVGISLYQTTESISRRGIANLTFFHK